VVPIGKYKNFTTEEYIAMSKPSTVYVSAQKVEELEKLLKEAKDYCKELRIDTTAKLLHVLANLGKKEFLRRVEEARQARQPK